MPKTPNSHLQRMLRFGLTCFRNESTYVSLRQNPSGFSFQYLIKFLAIIGLAALSLGFGCPAHTDTTYESANQPEVSLESYKREQNESKRNFSIRFLTDVNAAIEAAGVIGGDYDARITRKVHFDALRIRRWFLHFGFQEENLFDPSPSQLDHELEYLGIGYEIGRGRIKLFWDHTCHNPSRKLPKEKRNDIHWNELGIGYETIGMMLGHKNDGIEFDSGFEWLNSINWRASVSKIFQRTENKYEWMFKLGARDDVFKIGNQVFYIQLEVNSIYDDRGVRLNPSVEIGDRISLNENICLIPFVSYKHFHDWYSLGEGEDFFFAGLGLEMGLRHGKHNNFSNPGKLRISWAPEIHIDGGYASIVNNEDYGYSSDVAFDLDLLKLYQDKTFTLNTYAGILTLPDDLNPYLVKYDIGPSLTIGLDYFDLRIFHSYSCLYGLVDTGVIRNYNLLALGLKNNNASHWDWNAQIGGYPSTKNFDYWGYLRGSLGFNSRIKRITPYIQCSGHYLPGRSSVFGYAIEAGGKIPGESGDFSLYLSFQDDFDFFRFGKGTQTLLGFRCKF
ncbi:MAG: hypothetical protein ACFFCW_31510 [Candidatus Hodarchaeota archaeon]